MRKVWLCLALALLLAACGKNLKPPGELPPSASRWDASSAKWDDPATTWGP